MKKYTDKENAFIEKCYSKRMKISDIAEKLDRPEASVAKQAHRLGLKKGDGYVDYWGNLNWNPKKFSINGFATMQKAIFKRGMKI